MNIEETVRMFSNCYIKDNKIVVQKDFKEFIVLMKNDYKFDMLKQIIATDNQNDGIELSYQLYSSDNNEDIFVAQVVTQDAETVTDIFKSAIADENEIYDLFGINFIGNENLKRLYMPESWEGFPLRKDYVQNDTRLAWNDDNEIQT